MRQELAVQLDEFLEKGALVRPICDGCFSNHISYAECAPFIDTLFTVLRTKSYLPYAPTSNSPPTQQKSLEEGIPIPLDGLVTPSSSEPPRTRKRSNTGDDRDGRPPSKGPRLNNDTQFSRYGNGGDGNGPPSSGAWNPQQQFNGGGMGMGMNPYAVPMNGMGMNGMVANGMGPMNNRRPQGYQPPDQKRGICRDYFSAFQTFRPTYDL